MTRLGIVSTQILSMKYLDILIRLSEIRVDLFEGVLCQVLQFVHRRLDSKIIFQTTVHVGVGNVQAFTTFLTCA